MKHLLRLALFAALFAMLPYSIFSQEKYAVLITGDYADVYLLNDASLTINASTIYSGIEKHV